MRNKILHQIVTVSLLLIALECTPFDYELSYSERHQKEAIRMDNKGYAHCYCDNVEKKEPLRNLSLGFVYRTLHHKGLCTKTLSPKICSFFEECNRCIATTVRCEPVLGGYHCVNATILFQQLHKNNGSKNRTIWLHTDYNFDSEKGMNVPQVKKSMNKESELKKLTKNPQIVIHHEENQEVQKELAPKLQRNFTTKSEVFRLRFYTDKDNRLSLVMQNLTREKASASVEEGKDKKMGMDNFTLDEGLKQKHGISKRSALDDGVAKVKFFEQEFFEENQEGAADYQEETEDPLNKLHEVHCKYPTTGRTYATEVSRFQTYDLITQKCNYGYTFQEGIARSMRCEHDKDVLEPMYEIWTEECKPFLNCTVQFLRSGYAKCKTGLWFKPPTCEVICEYYLDGDNPVDYHTCDVHKGWIPDLPSCAIPGSKAGLMPAPVPMLHEVY